MKLPVHGGFSGGPIHASSTVRRSRAAAPADSLRQNSIAECRFVGEISIRRNSCASFPIRQNTRSSFSIHCLQDSQDSERSDDVGRKSAGQILSTRRAVLGVPLIAIGARFLQSAVVRAEEKSPETVTPVLEAVTSPSPSSITPTAEEEVITSRIYDATVIGEPLAVGKDKRKVWEKIMNARIVYLGEAEQVPIRDDKELELEIVKSLKRRCGESERVLSLALEAFPSDLQEQLNQYIDKSIDGETLKSYTSHWPPQRWQEYEPLLSYCRENGVRLIACGTPLKILRTVQAEGIRGLSKADRKVFAPPAGSGFISGFTAISRRTSADLNSSYQPIPFGPSSYLSAQSRVVEEYAMSKIILQAMQDGGGTGMLVVVTGASHVTYGSRGTGLPARISRKVPKKNQVVVLLDPERQQMRREGEVPVADFLWYSAARPCNRNCFDRAEIARVMNAAGRKRDGLPQDIQKGLDLGVVSPEVLQNFFDLEQYPLIAELTHRFQGFRERLLADPKFLHRLAIEEAISLTTTLLAQYERRKENFFLELDYVITDTLRGAVVDFFTVWLPAPTLAFLSTDDMDVSGSTDILQGLLGSIPDNAFQKNLAGKNWNLSHRVASVLFGGLKLASVGFISSIGAVASSNALFTIRKFLNPAVVTKQRNKRSPILKTAAVYGCFLGTSANLRYQIIAGIVEHRFSDAFSSQILLVNMLSFVVRTLNSYWGTQQWIDLARYTGLQTRESPSYQVQESPNPAALGCQVTEEATQASPDEFKNQ
ncbi:protein RETICULATA-RELATED 5, chloroplastic [Benincasa hispida]|uniref:protein RETICULATA-RELATED 5, chloroplastic n=1 Tax=Benincasa hispida TaxID=102211 RepID=UPI0019002A8A|nr:protein RETICULATA-RELATED 5, chloroplastic [Benincasa hispida]